MRQDNPQGMSRALFASWEWAGAFVSARLSAWNVLASPTLYSFRSHPQETLRHVPLLVILLAPTSSLHSTPQSHDLTFYVILPDPTGSSVRVGLMSVFAYRCIPNTKHSN